MLRQLHTHEHHKLTDMHAKLKALHALDLMLPWHRVNATVHCNCNKPATAVADANADAEDDCADNKHTTTPCCNS